MRIIIGSTYGRLLVQKIFHEHDGKRNIRKVKCLCSCGKEHITSYACVAYGHSKSCGCLHAENSSYRIRKQNTTHGESKTKFFKTYLSIHGRTHDKTNRIYGGKGITSEWKTYLSFRNDMYQSYLEHVSIHGEKNTSIDRIDSNGNYTKDNCRWSTRLVQSNNTSRNHNITYQGKTQSLAMWCRELGLKYSTIRSRIYILGKTPEEAFI